jgi:AraC family transcriptional regulator, transcriptional activator of pobA
MDGSRQRLDNPNMMKPELPAYALYGEAGAAADPLHCESIAARSRLHDWEIRPHRHGALFQVLVVLRGRGQAHLDGREVALRGPALVTVPPLVAHGFSFQPTIDGLVFTVDERHLDALLAAQQPLWTALRVLRAWPLQRGAAAARELAAAARALRDEVQGHAAWRAAAIDAALLRLLVVVARTLPPEPAATGEAPPRALAHLQRLRAEIEARFRAQPSVAALAAPLGITPTQLNRVCRRVLGTSALDVLHARLLLEAQRDLAYTSMSVKEIALDLGFADAAYFTRFFQRRAGVTPTAYRRRRQASSAATSASA